MDERTKEHGLEDVRSDLFNNKYVHIEISGEKRKGSAYPLWIILVKQRNITKEEIRSYVTFLTL